MTKQYGFNINKYQIEQNGKYFAYLNVIDVKKIVEELNSLSEENKQLKQQLNNCEQKKQNIKDMLLYSEPIIEQKKIQELVYNIVFDLIDEKIEEYKKYDGYDTEKYYIGTQLLKELKRELKSDVE